MRQRKPQLLSAAYLALHCGAALAFALAMLTTLPPFHQAVAMPLFTLLVQASAAMMAMAEAVELVVQPVPRWSLGICAVSLTGNLLYFAGSLLY
jgi:hypothetical protein